MRPEHRGGAACVARGRLRALRGGTASGHPMLCCGRMSAERGAAELPRVLGLWDAICVVIGAIIGVGIFFTPRDVASLTGSAATSLLAWSLARGLPILGN